MIASPPAGGVACLRYQPLRTNEIRLLLLQRGEESDPIRFSLVHVVLSTSRKSFTALSYTWGDASTKRPIECNDLGERALLTSNCEKAIRRLRSQTEDRLYWIDAICINQDDLLEREVQVGRMGDIYRSATDVVVYLGEEENDSDRAMYFLSSLREHSWDIVLHPHTRLALKDLLNRPWFERVWVLQEVHNAKHVRVVCGYQEAAWANLLLFKWWHHLGRRDFDQWPFVMFIRDRSRYSTNDFLRLLLQCRKSGATDPRDKVYAILPMIRDGNRDFLRPDYTISKETVYLETARCLSKSGLGFLCAVSHPEGYLVRRTLPSWVPAWDEDMASTLIWPDTGSTVVEETVLNRDGDNLHDPYRINSNESYQAGGIVNQVLPIYEVISWPGTTSTAQLRVRGTRVTTIEQLSASIPFSIKDLASSRSILDEMWETMKPITCHTRYIHSEAEFRWAQHPLHQSIDAAMMHRMRRKPVWQDDISAIQPSDRDRTSHHQRLAEMHASREASGVYQRWCEEFVGLINGRRIFVTADGGMGMAPVEAQVGDSICVIHGAPVPFVLRAISDKHEAGYLFVGSCYLNGMMTSDGFEKLKMERERLPISDGMAFGKVFVLL